MKTRSPQFCLRCDGVELSVAPDSTENIAFYDCPSCRRRFAQASGRGLCERWPGPLGLLLYGIIFEPHPPDASGRIAAQLLARKTRDEIAWVMTEVERELAQPTQKVCEIVGLRQSEEEVRAFLGGVVGYWRRALDEGRMGDAGRA